MNEKLKGKQIKTQSITLSGDTGHVIVVGDLNMKNFNITSDVIEPTDDTLVNKKYVDQRIIDESLIIAYSIVL